MSLPPELSPGLPHEVAERVQQPGFDAVLDRAGAIRRRRRTTIASGLAAAVALAGATFVLGGQLSSDDRTPQPAGVITSWDGTSDVDPRLPDDVQSFLREGQLQPFFVSGSSGAITTLWGSCPGNASCAFALTTRNGDDVSGSLLEPDAPSIAPVTSGWLLEDTRGTRLLTPSGDLEPIVDTGPGSADVVAGDIAVGTRAGERLLRGTKLIPVPSPPERETTSAYVTPAGRLIATSISGASIAISTTDDGSTWEMALASRTSEPVSGALIAGSGDHVAVALLGDAPDGSVPLVEVQVSHDAGATWASVRGLDTRGADRVRDLSSIAVTAAGTTYVNSRSEGLVRIDGEGNALSARFSSHDTSAFVVDDTVCLVVETGRVDELRCSPDDGTTWVPQPLPGFS